MKQKGSYASSKARMKCATYSCSQYMIMWAVDRFKRYGSGKLFFGSIDRYWREQHI